MTATLDERAQALPLPRFLAPETGDALVRPLWKDLLAGRAQIQTHQEEGLRKTAVENPRPQLCAAPGAALGPDAYRHRTARPRPASELRLLPPLFRRRRLARPLR